MASGCQAIEKPGGGGATDTSAVRNTDSALGDTLAKYPGVDGITEACNLYEALKPKPGVPATTASNGTPQTVAARNKVEDEYLSTVKPALDAIAKARVQLTGQATCGFQPGETLDKDRSVVINAISNGVKTLRGNGVVNAGAEASKAFTGQADREIAQARRVFTGSQTLIEESIGSARAAVITPPTGVVGQQYLTLNEKATTARAQIDKLAADLKEGPQAKLEAVLKKAEATAVGDEASIAKVVAVNDRLAAMTKGITKVNETQKASKRPEITPPTVEPVGDTAKDPKAEPETVVSNAEKAASDIKKACNQIGLDQDCKSNPTLPIDEPELVSVKLAMDALPATVTAARQSQTDVLAGISADITAISKTAGGPTLMGEQSTSLSLPKK